MITVKALIQACTGTTEVELVRRDGHKQKKWQFVVHESRKPFSCMKWLVVHALGCMIQNETREVSLVHCHIAWLQREVDLAHFWCTIAEPKWHKPPGQFVVHYWLGQEGHEQAFYEQPCGLAHHEF